MANPLVAQRQSSTTWHSGINLFDDAAGLYDGVQSGSWVEGGLSAFGVGMDVLTIAMNPVGTLISYGLNWLIEHVQPLQDALNQLAGDADQIQAYSKTWGNIATAVGKAAQDLTTAVKTDTANWTGQAADTYRANVTDKIDHINAAATCASTISTVVEMVGVLTAAVRMIVRDMVTQAVGDFIQDALEEAFSLGLGTPVVVAQVVEQVSEWITKITGVIKKLLNSVEALRPLMSKLEEIWSAIQKVMNALHGHAGGDEPHLPSDSTHPSSVDEPPTTTTPSDATTPSSAPHDAPPDTGDPAPTTGPADPTDPTTPSSSDGTTPSSADDEPPTGGQQSDGNGGCDGKGGDPVDAVSGQMITSVDDVELPGLLPLVLRRAYASGYRGGRSHGPGWASTLDQRLEFGPLGVRYFGDDAEQLHYPLPTGRAAVPEFGARWPLTWDGVSDTYRVEDPRTGWVRHFGPGRGTPGVRPITALTDRNGNRVDYVRDDHGVPIGITSSAGYRIDVGTQRTDDGVRLTGLTLRRADLEPAPLVGYRYDTAGRLVEVVDAAGLPFRYEYDDAHRITAWVDRENYRYRYVYDADGRVVRGEGDGGVLSADFAYDLDNRISTVTDSLGNTTAYHYDEFQHVTKIVDPLGGVELTEYDRNHHLLSRTDALGNTTRYTRDADGSPVRVDRPDGTAITLSYNELRLPVEFVGPDGGGWHYDYDERGNLVRLTDPAGAVTSYGYGPRGEPTSVTDPLGRTTTVVTDAAGLPLSVTGPSGATETYQRDAAGRLVAVTDPMGAVTTTEWSATNKPLRCHYPDGTTQTWQWNRNGDLVAATDPGGATTRYEIGAFHEVAARTDPDGARHVFGHDTELRLVQVVNPQGLVWRYTYDAAGNLAGEQDFNGRTLRYAHDAMGQLVELVNGAGETTAITRDAIGRITEQRGSDGRHTRFAYDPAGRLTHASNADCELRFTRDALGRVLAEAVDGRVVASAYDTAGQRTSRTTPTGRVSSWQYDAVGRPLTVTAAGQRITFGHDAAGRETHRWLGPHIAVTSAWNPVGQLTARQLVDVTDRDGGRISELLFGRTWTYRADGLPNSVTDDLEGTRRFDLDPLGRVTSVHAATWQERYEYDSSGNLTFSADSRAAGSPVAGPRLTTGTLLRRAGRSHFDYDAQGRLVRTVRQTLSGRRQIWTYRYDSQDQLVDVVNPAGHRWRYRYDPLGRRVAKQRLDGPTVVEEVRFSWDGDTVAEQEHRGPDTAVTATTWDYEPGALIPVSQDRRRFDGRTPQDVIDRQFHAIVTDLIGTPTELVTTEGRIDWRRRAGLWGNEYRPATGSAHECLLRFPGQYHDYETGLDYNHHRYYDPETARYTGPDPLGLDPAPNHHGYVDNPLTWTDPLGLAGITKARYLYLDRPGYWNYVLKDSSGKIYYVGRAGPNETVQSVARRHAANGDRFNPDPANPANGDTLERVPGSRTYGQARLMEQDMIDKNGTFIGKGAGTQRGNVIRGMDPDKLAEYQDYENRKNSGLGCPK
ncbi:MAG TPA: RHS repeat-associated core domain-containing protein [Pseudonocardiaceae bacterium]|nr:RHS repeat-associated core domain-containing protein [Pseudonocardiaceae bacterium]